MNLSVASTARTVLVPGTSREAMTAGAYVSKVNWVNDTGGDSDASSFSAPLGARSDFSGRGPTRDGRIKPEIGAPGEWVGSTISNQRSPPRRCTRT